MRSFITLLVFNFATGLLTGATTFMNGVAGNGSGLTNIYLANGAQSLGCVSKTPPFSPWIGYPIWEDDSHTVCFAESFISGGMNSGSSTATSSGGVSTVAATPPAGSSSTLFLYLDTYPTNTSSYAAWRVGGGASYFTFDSNVWFEASVFCVPGTANFTNASYIAGMVSTVTVAPADAVYWRARPDWNTNWIATVMVNSSMIYNSTSSFPCAINTRMNLGIVGTTNSITFLTNGVPYYTHTGLIPGGRTTCPQVANIATYSTGTSTLRNRFVIDYLSVIYQ